MADASSSSSKRMITLISGGDDGIPYTIACAAEAIVPQSNKIKNIIIQNFINYINVEISITLPETKAPIVKKVVEYCENHSPSVTIHPNLLKASDKLFIKQVHKDEDISLFDLIVAANFLEIDTLSNLATEAVVAMYQGKTIDQI